MANNTKSHSEKKSGQKDRDKETRRSDAEARQSVYDLLSIQQKISLLDKKGMIAKKQRAKLEGGKS